MKPHVKGRHEPPREVAPQSLLPEDPLCHVAIPTQVALALLGGMEGVEDLLEGSSCSDLPPEEQLSPPKPARLFQSSSSRGLTWWHYQLQPAACYVQGCPVLGGLQCHPDRVSALLAGRAGGDGAPTSPALGQEGCGGTMGISITSFFARKACHRFMERDLGARQGEELT